MVSLDSLFSIMVFIYPGIFVFTSCGRQHLEGFFLSPRLFSSWKYWGSGYTFHTHTILVIPYLAIIIMTPIYIILNLIGLSWGFLLFRISHLFACIPHSILEVLFWRRACATCPLWFPGYFYLGKLFQPLYHCLRFLWGSVTEDIFFVPHRSS